MFNLRKDQAKKKKNQHYIQSDPNQIKAKNSSRGRRRKPNPCAKLLALGRQSESSVAVRYEEWAHWAEDGQQQRPSFRYSIDHCHK